MSDEPYVVEFASAAQRSLARLSGRVVRAVIEFIAGPLADNPHSLSESLRTELDGTCSARRGGYRVLLRIDEQSRTVVVLDINHRAHIYRT